MSLEDMKLTEIEINEIPQLIERYKTHHESPLHRVILHLKMIVNHSLGRKVYASLNINHYSLVVMTHIHTSEQFRSVTLDWDCQKLTDDDVQTLILTLPKWNQQTSALFLSMVRRKLEPRIRNIFESKKLIDPNLKIRTYVYGNSYHFNSEIPKCTVPEGYELGNLQPRHSQFVFGHWHDQWMENCETYKNYLQIFPSVAVFLSSEKDDHTRNPVSWAMQYQYGYVGNVFTVERHRKKGLAKLVLAKLMQQIDKDVYIDIDHGNDNSEAYHCKLGFKKLPEEYGWFVYIPKDKTLNEYLQS